MQSHSLSWQHQPQCGCSSGRAAPSGCQPGHSGCPACQKQPQVSKLLHEVQGKDIQDCDYHDWESAHKDVDLPDLTLNWPRNMENLEEYFCGCVSMTGIPLVYVTRENPEVLPEADDPVDSMQDELIASALILTMANLNAFMAMYLTDCQHIWDKIIVITCDLDCWTYVHPTQHARDGCKAYQNLNGHYLGVNNVDNLSTILMCFVMELHQKRQNYVICILVT